jgi:hypothetical protein
MDRYRRWIAIVVVASALVVSAVAEARPASAVDNVIGVENQKPGSVGWRTAHLVDEIAKGPREEPSAGSTARGVPDPNVSNNGLTPVKGYAGAQSVNKGEPLKLYISTTVPTFDLVVYRMGWYGGTGGTVVSSTSGVTASDQPVAAPDPVTGLIAMNWTSQYTVATQTSWTSGFYLVQMTPTAGGVSGYIPFVLRDDASAAAIVYQIPLNTYHAYNGFGGKSLYDDIPNPSARSYKVSFDRPFIDEDGAGNFFESDYPMIRFLEREGFDITYVASTDVANRPGLMNNHKAFLSVFHDEYWTFSMRSNLESWIAAGKHVAFLGGNSMYRQVRFEPSAAGAADRVMVGYKAAALDPLAATQPQLTTVEWRYEPLNRPENAVLGSMYEGFVAFGANVPWVVQNANHWLYAGTGLINGDQIASLVGYEWDRTYDNGFQPAGVTVLADSPVVLPGADPGSRHNATIRQTPSGAIVFNAGTMYWPRMLDDAVGPLDTRVQVMTRNLLNRFADSTPATGARTFALRRRRRTARAPRRSCCRARPEPSLVTCSSQRSQLRSRAAAAERTPTAKGSRAEPVRGTAGGAARRLAQERWPGPVVARCR